MVKKSACSVGDPGSIPGLVKSHGEGYGNRLQDYCLGNTVDRGAWWGYSPWGHRVRHSVVNKPQTVSLRVRHLQKIFAPLSNRTETARGVIAHIFIRFYLKGQILSH